MISAAAAKKASTVIAIANVSFMSESSGCIFLAIKTATHIAMISDKGANTIIPIIFRLVLLHSILQKIMLFLVQAVVRLYISKYPG